MGNEGFVALNTPLGFVLVVVGMLLLFAFIIFGGAIFKVLSFKDVELRRELKRQLEEREHPIQPKIDAR